MHITQGNPSTVSTAQNYELREVSQYTANDEQRASELDPGECLTHTQDAHSCLSPAPTLSWQGATETLQMQQSCRMLETIDALQSLQKICEIEWERQRRNSVSQQFAELGTALSVHEQQWTAARQSLQYESRTAETLEFVKGDIMKMAALKKGKTKCEVWPPKELELWEKIFTTHKDMESLTQVDTVRPPK